MRIPRGLALVVALSLTLEGCASYSPTSAPVPRAVTMPVSRTEGNLLIGVDPHVQSDRQKVVFDGNLSEAGILPIQIGLENQGGRRLLIRRTDMMLVLPSGQRLSPAGASAAASRMESIGGVVGAAIAFGISGYLAASSAEEKARTARLVDFRNKELREDAIGKGESTHGFVFFIPLAETPAFTEATLILRVVDVEEGTGTLVSLPLTGLDFKGTQEPAQQQKNTTSEPSNPSRRK